jgi:hypothetical protein
MLIGKLVKEEGDLGERGDPGDHISKRYFLLTALLTQAAQGLAELLEQDINPDEVTSRKIGGVLRKMRLPHSRQPRTGKKGWMVALSDVIRWANSYGLDSKNITGLNIDTHYNEVTTVTTVTEVTPKKSTVFEGIL